MAKMELEKINAELAIAPNESDEEHRLMSIS